MLRPAVVALLLALGAPAATGAQTPAPAASPANDASVGVAVDAVAHELIATKHVPGVAVAVERHGAIVFERGYGVSDVAKKTPVGTDTRFEIGSVTKQFTAACVLQLVEAGKLSLDDRLGTFVSDYFVGRGVTVWQLLDQTSGIPEFLDGPDVIASAGTQPATYATLLARVSAQPLDFAPGTRWRYSNTNYILLGRIVELVSHESYEAYVRTHIFAPAGMTQSDFISAEPTLAAMAHGYAPSASGTSSAPPLRDDWASSAGAIVSTVGDVIKWDDALLAGKIVSPDDVVRMRTRAKLNDGALTSYGFGWLVDTLGGHPRIWHNGGTFGFHAVNVTFPRDDEAIVLLTNSSYVGADAAVTELFEKLHPDVAATMTASAAGEDPKITARVREWLKRFEDDDIDRAQLTDQMSHALSPTLTAQVKQQFAPLGTPERLVYRGETDLAGNAVYRYSATFAVGTFGITMSLDAQGKIAGYLVSPS